MIGPARAEPSSDALAVIIGASGGIGRELVAAGAQ